MVAGVSKIPSLFKAATKNAPLSKLSTGELKDLLNSLRRADKDSAMFQETAKVEKALSNKPISERATPARGENNPSPRVKKELAKKQEDSKAANKKS